MSKYEQELMKDMGEHKPKIDDHDLIAELLAVIEYDELSGEVSLKN